VNALHISYSALNIKFEEGIKTMTQEHKIWRKSWFLS